MQLSCALKLGRRIAYEKAVLCDRALRAANRAVPLLLIARKFQIGGTAVKKMWRKTADPGLCSK